VITGLKILEWVERKQWDRFFARAWADNGCNDERAADTAWALLLKEIRSKDPQRAHDLRVLRGEKPATLHSLIADAFGDEVADLTISSACEGMSASHRTSNIAHRTSLLQEAI